MKSLSIPLLLLAAFLIQACTGDPAQKEAKTIMDKEKAFMESTESQPDKKEGFLLVKAYMDFVQKFPTDSLSPKFLYSAGRLALNINDAALALRNLEDLRAKYPDHPLSADGLFLMAFIHENNYQDFPKAQGLYQEFIQRYPSHTFFDDAQASLKNLGKSPEEIIREFENANALMSARKNTSN